ncbi:predicted protein [Chaetomium globosum CBS 148.51]|uniref:Uncharacterized protein n=1 Tax=Chaetomium globosum (strain ATCC 6205 / CBS 148.51 / DSM 1962 / NBRC 6347 / NRRL 1970) TaxID=306901 RepID=Q2GNF4_CHAGB|nr:uncharacterized protein CHGG_10500 [Chaetomium globosum CBS 148.51]EAQ84096.1 predicted protein [Chaetomium globosum CBS 148.51]
MSQGLDKTLQLLGEEQPSTGTSYSLERYLNSDGGLTERLLGGLGLDNMVSRTQTVRCKVNALADRTAQQPQGSS